MSAPSRALRAYEETLLGALPSKFLVDPLPLDPEGRYSRRACVAPGCERISQRKAADVCRVHWDAWRRSDDPDLTAWLSTAPVLITHSDSRAARGYFDLRLSEADAIRHELAFGLWKRGLRGTVTSPDVVNRLARELGNSRLASILDMRDDRIRIEQVVVACESYADRARSFLLDALDEVCLLVGAEPTRRYLGIASAGGGAFTNLNEVESDEFRSAIARWMQYRSDAELASPQWIQSIVGFAVAFCRWLCAQGVRTWGELDRRSMQAYLVRLSELRKQDNQPFSAKYRAQIISGLSTFIDEVSANGWANIPPSARWMRHERPKPDTREPTLMGSQVAARLRHPGNLQLVEDPDCRLAIRIMAETGLRRNDVVAGLRTDCVLDLGEDAWSLRYLNSKTKALATTPVRPELAAAVAEHAEYKRQKLPGCKNLFARDEFDRVLTLTIINAELKRLVERLDLRGSDGELLRITPHMFRHQNATDWLNNGVSMPVVQKLLDHRSMTTTQIYARMSERTVREQWEKARAVNRDGELVPAPSGILEDAAWTHAFMGGATQALPNGRCGMPCTDTCDHANACLYCPLFITTPDYLPVLREQRQEHETMMHLAEAEGHQRIVERNRKPFIALSKLIENLEQIAGQPTDPEASRDG